MSFLWSQICSEGYVDNANVELKELKMCGVIDTITLNPIDISQDVLKFLLVGKALDMDSVKVFEMQWISFICLKLPRVLRGPGIGYKSIRFNWETSFKSAVYSFISLILGKVSNFSEITTNV